VAGRVEDNGFTWDELIRSAGADAVKIVTERTARDGKSLMPEGSERYPAPGHTRRNPAGGSWPPGTMRRSVTTSYRTTVMGKTTSEAKYTQG
jgi:hypothetical protein